MSDFSCDFGLLPEPVDIQTPNWVVEPLPNCQTTIDTWQAIGSDSTWVYPPMQFTATRRYSKRKKALVARRVPGSTRQALVWHVPATHRLVYRGSASLPTSLPKPPIATFIIYLVGMLHGAELQHAEWFVTGRQHKTSRELFVPLPGSLEHILDVAAAWFGHIPQDTQTCITSALYIHNHVPAYQWDWERFAWQYGVFEAAWFTAKSTGAVPRDLQGGGHGQRFTNFSTVFRMKTDPPQFAKWVTCRNDLIHQAIWGDAIPGHVPRTQVSSYYLPLRTFATLALLAAIGYKGKTARMPWDTANRLGLYP